MIKNVISGRRDVSVLVQDRNNKVHKVLLEDALYVPSYSQNTLGQATTEKGESASLRAPDDTVFDIEKRGRLYYLNKTLMQTAAPTVWKSGTKYLAIVIL